MATKEHENIAPLSALEKLGYSEKELKLLRPQVLELIVDDRIPRPRRGIPKRWVKSMNEDEYDEEEERYDDDFGWQVQVVPRKKPKKRDIRTESQNNDAKERVNVPKDDVVEARDERIDNETDATRRSSDCREDKPLRRENDESLIKLINGNPCPIGSARSLASSNVLFVLPKSVCTCGSNSLTFCTQ